ncbi:hypothetical protein A4W93_05810 [Piscinibacter gummiphilus]|uniref:Type IV pilus modification protein PilV n=1 Tax=Piscinibacter gummiphilus TaxID=946333 RepID=A0A1W6L583_9BURK|nr:hypothetical protein A4W93_05810 [Piscinibacter gummiphilus]
MPRPRAAGRRRQAGITLIELLVSLLIFSFGMLGLAGLHIRTLAYSQSSLFRSQATALADDVLDRMRADRTNARDVLTGPGTWVTDIDQGFEDIGSNNTDLADWKQSVGALLPGGKASIAVAGDGLVTVTIAWRDTKDTGGDTPDPLQSFVTVSRL